MRADAGARISLRVAGAVVDTPILKIDEPLMLAQTSIRRRRLTVHAFERAFVGKLRA